MQAGTIQFGDGTLETAWWGPGPQQAPTLVLLHEGLGCTALWRDVPERLAAATGWGVFAYSRFGYGASDTTPLPRPMTYMHHEAQTVLPEILRAAGIRQAVLVGHSDGGSIAAIYAGTFPDDFRPDVSLPASGHDTEGRTRLLGLVTIAAHFFVEDLNIASIGRIGADYQASDLRQRLARYHRDVDAAFYGWHGAWLDPRFQVPILALQGADDPYGTEEQLRVFAAKVRAPITPRLIRGAKHAPHLEAKDETLTLMTDFISDLRRGSLT
jgi:pimeloyl-ACP methyl ester carboxylesterase